MFKKETLEQQIMSLMFLAGRNLRQEGNKENCLEAKQRLSVIQFETLKFIDEQKNPLMRSVAEHLLIAPPTLTQLIDELEKKKYVQRVSSQGDRRAILIILTKKGKLILQKNLEIRTQKLGLIFQKLSKEEQEILVRIMKKLAFPKN